MAAGDKVFAGSIPEIYDTYLVPLIFGAFAEDLATRVTRPGVREVLETAAGSGVVTRALAPKLPGDTRYVVSDLNQPMLDRAAGQQPPDDRIVWQQADALELPFADASFDAVCCQFGAMFFPDKVAGYAEARRVLRPGGRFVFNVWDRIEDNLFAHLATEAAASVFPDDPPRFLARIPHGYHDVDMIREDLRQAGFSRIDMVTLTVQSRAPSARHAAVAYCQGTPMRNEIEARDPSLLELTTDRATEAIAAVCGDGPVSGMIRGHVIEAGF